MAKITTPDFISAIKEMTVVEIRDLVKAIETEFGVTAAVAVAAGPSAASEAPVAAAKTDFTVFLKSFGANKLPVIKIIQTFTGAGLMDAKKLVESAPVVIKEGVPTAQAEEIKTKLTEAGAEVVLQ